MRRIATTVSLVSIIVASCNEDPKPATDCTDRGGVCLSIDGVFIGPNWYICNPEAAADQCGHAELPYPATCCALKRCGENSGRTGYCRTPCAPEKTIGESDPACANPTHFGYVEPGTQAAFAACCESLSGK